MLKQLLVGVLVGTLLFSGPAMSETQAKPQAQAKGSTSYTARLERLYQRLDLSQAQQAQFNSVISKIQPIVQAKLTQMGRSRLIMSKLLYSESFSPEAVDKIATMQGNLFAELVKINAKMKRDVYEILTPQQRKKLAEIVQSKKSKAGSTL